MNCIYGSSRIVLLTIQLYGRMAGMRIGSKYLSIENCNLKLNFEKKEV
nr:MAG TPA: hypothetical protein [Caudoviricetes sp.]